MDKQRIRKICCKSARKLINFSVTVRYVAVIVVLLSGFIGSWSFAGFGIDSEEKLYIGRKKHIEVYQNGRCIEILPTPFQKEGWYMGITSDDFILLVSGDKVFTAELDGTIIEEKEDVNSHTTAILAKQKKTRDHNGNQYQLRCRHIWPTVTKNGKVIYRAPFWDMLVRVLFVSGWIIIIISGFSNCAVKRDDST